LGKTVGEVLAMPSSEYVGWIEYHNKTPFRAERQNFQLAMLLAMFYNSHRSDGADAKDANDFMPWLADRPAVTVPQPQDTTMQTADELKGINLGMAMFKAKLAKVTNA
jgi:hypothetical protein